MKKVLIIILLLFTSLIIIILFCNKPTTVNNKESFSTNNSNNEPKEEGEVFEIYNYNGISYEIRFLVLEDLSKVKLMSNLEEKLEAEEIMNEMACGALISAGFYDKNDKHIGLFISEYKPISEDVESKTFNGFFSVDRFEKPSIGIKPLLLSRFSVQAGPILISDKNVLNLKISDDFSARRIVVAVTEGNEVIFFEINKRNSLISGPKLADLPKVVKYFSMEKGFVIEEALNLDGGSHSAFYFYDNRVSELSTIGGYFCIKSEY